MDSKEIKIQEFLLSYYREGEERKTLEHIQNLMTNLGLTCEKAMDALEISKKEQDKYLAKLS